METQEETITMFCVCCTNKRCEGLNKTVLTSTMTMCKLCNQPMKRQTNKPVEIEDAVIIDEKQVVKAIDTDPVQFENGVAEQAYEEKEQEINIENLDIEKVIKESVDSFVAGKETLIKYLLDEHLKRAIKKIKPVVITMTGRAEVKMEGKMHKAFSDCLFLAQHERQLFIAGPAGSGKTTLAAQVAKGLGLTFDFISCSSGMSEAHLLGRMLFDGTYVPSDLVKAYENGGLFLFDEIDAADANTLLIINSALANGHLSVPNRKDKPVAHRHADFVCICAGNTWGNGSFEYQGRNHLDAAFLDRFALSKVMVDYDTELEKDIVGSHTKAAERLWAIRKNVTKGKIRRVVSTRAFVSIRRQIEAGKGMDEVLRAFFIGWSDEEVKKAIEGIGQVKEEKGGANDEF